MAAPAVFGLRLPAFDASFDDQCGTPRASWLIVAEDVEAEKDLPGNLDAGEAAAIALAHRLHAEVILIDEQEGRRCAQARGFITADTLNILAQAGIRDWLDFHAITARLKTETNFRTTQSVIDAAWQSVQPR